MKKIAWNRKSKIALAVLLIAVPTGLLSAFRLMRAELEPVMVEPVNWQMYRPKLDPDHSLIINETVKNGYSDNYASMEISVHLYHYVEDWGEIPFGKNNDGVTFKVDVAAAVAEDFNSSFVVRFRTVDDYSTIYVQRQFENVSGQYLATYNATIIELRAVSREWTSEGWHNLGEAYVKAESTSSHCGLRGQIYWVFNDQNVEDHQLEVTLEFTYCSQTTIQKIVVPIILEMPIST